MRSKNLNMRKKNVNVMNSRYSYVLKSGIKNSIHPGRSAIINFIKAKVAEMGLHPSLE
jgi:hypothetical protein